MQLQQFKITTGLSHTGFYTQPVLLFKWFRLMSCSWRYMLLKSLWEQSKQMYFWTQSEHTRRFLVKMADSSQCKSAQTTLIIISFDCFSFIVPRSYFSFVKPHESVVHEQFPLLNCMKTLYINSSSVKLHESVVCEQFLLLNFMKVSYMNNLGVSLLSCRMEARLQDIHSVYSKYRLISKLALHAAWYLGLNQRWLILR